MLNKKDKGYVLYILDHTKRIIEKTKNITIQEFMSDRDIQDITAFHLLHIGELAKKLSKEFLDEYNGVPWKNIKGMRDKIAHGYEDIEFEQVWNVSKKYVIELQEYCKKIIK